jgi:hypothetical protein
VKVAFFVFTKRHFGYFYKNGVEVAYNWRIIGVYASTKSSNFAPEIEKYKQ